MWSGAISSASSLRSITFGIRASREAQPMTSLAHFEKIAGVIERPGQAVIGGRFESARSGRTFDNVMPRNGTVINGRADFDAADVDLAVAAARRAFDDGRWRNLRYGDKKQALFALADLMERDAETLAVLVWINGWEAGDITMPFGGFK